MIERFFKKEVHKKRWNRFRHRKSAYYSLCVLIILILLTLISPFLANSKPNILSYNGHIYFPTIKSYHPKKLNLNDDILVVNYRKLELKEGDWAFWPPIPWDPFEGNIDVDSYPSKPTSKNWLGTDDRGRDVLTRLLYGLKYCLAYSLLVWLFSIIIGTISGAIMGYFGGKIDFVGQRLVEILSTVPQFFLLIILISIFNPNLTLLVIISSLFSWISISYYIRGEFLKNRKREYVEAAKSLGASSQSIIFKHILPNSLAPIITFTPFIIAGNIVGLASLDYLGFGLAVPTPSWGELLAQAQKNYSIAWWLAVYPSLALFFTLTLFALVGEGVRDAMDPNLN